jgi:hypothetical protein
MKRKILRAIALLKKHPDWPDSQIAQVVNAARPYISHDPLYRAARREFPRKRELVLGPYGRNRGRIVIMLRRHPLTGRKVMYSLRRGTSANEVSRFKSTLETLATGKKYNGPRAEERATEAGLFALAIQQYYRKKTGARGGSPKGRITPKQAPARKHRRPTKTEDRQA